MLHHTENATTTKDGQAVATVIADTVPAVGGARITTLELVYPRYIHGEFMTHRAFSRCAASSRATPLKVTLKEVYDDPVFFDYVGANCPGMVAGDELSPEKVKEFEEQWRALGARVAGSIEMLSQRFGIHKQTLNRALEPWLRIRTLVTATDWDNFFELRLAPDAQPEMQSLAKAMYRAMKASKPRIGELHVPYMDGEDIADEDSLMCASAARCARVSYARLDGRETSLGDDFALASRLMWQGHMSPFEHCARATEGRWANLSGWRSYRNVLEEEK